MKAPKLKLVTKKKISSVASKVYSSIKDKEEVIGSEMTHWYLNSLQNKVLCRILEKRGRSYVNVINENGCIVYLENSKVIKHKSYGNKEIL